MLEFGLAEFDGLWSFNLGPSITTALAGVADGSMSKETASQFIRANYYRKIAELGLAES